MRSRSSSVTTPNPILLSAGYDYRKPTKHNYSHSELVSVDDPVRRGHKIRGMGHFFRCTETGELRQWGFDAAFPEGN